jgi:hypothetical protein
MIKSFLVQDLSFLELSRTIEQGRAECHLELFPLLCPKVAFACSVRYIVYAMPPKAKPENE